MFLYLMASLQCQSQQFNLLSMTRLLDTNTYDDCELSRLSIISSRKLQCIFVNAALV